MNLKKATLHLLGIVILVTTAFLARSNALASDSTILVDEISNECPGTNTLQRADCIEQLAVKKVSADPRAAKEILDGFWALLKEKKIVDDARLFSPIIHEAGMALIDQGLDLEEAVSRCPASFRGACIHGVLMEYIDEKYHSPAPGAFLGLCKTMLKVDSITSSTYGNCVHGVGHELAAQIQGKLSDMLAPCSSVAPEFQNDCASGVFMEYSKGEAGQGYHSHAPVGKKEFDCSTVQPMFKDTCYTSAGFYRQYEIDSEPWTDSYAFCSGIPARYQEDCFRGLDSALLFSNVGDKMKSASVCKTLPKSESAACLDLLDSTSW